MQKNNNTLPIIIVLSVLLLAFKKPNKNNVIIEPIQDLPMDGYDFVTLVYKGAKFIDINTFNTKGLHNDTTPLKLSGKDYDLDKRFIIVNFGNKDYLVERIHTNRK